MISLPESRAVTVTRTQCSESVSESPGPGRPHELARTRAQASGPTLTLSEPRRGCDPQAGQGSGPARAAVTAPPVSPTRRHHASGH
jgi:hypothetical protein